MTTRHSLGLAVAIPLTLALSGGGGSGGSDASASVGPAVAETVPVSALTSTETFVNYQKALTESDTIEPLTLQQLLPPIDDTAEPFSIG